MQKRKATIVKQSTQGILALFKAAGVTPLQGHGRLLPGLKVEYTAHDGSKRTLQAKHVVLASGSQPMELKSAPFDGERIIDSWGALEMDTVPKRLGVIGAGVIGLELGSVWRRLGSEVVVLEALPDFLPMADGNVSREALRHFKKLGLDIRLGAKVTGAKVEKGEVNVSYSDAKGEQAVAVDKLVVAIGRRPFTKDLLADGHRRRTRRARLHRGGRPLQDRRRPTSGRSATACADRCWHTRARKRAWPSRMPSPVCMPR